MHNLSLTSLDSESVLSNNMTVIDAALDSVTHRIWVGAPEIDDMNAGGFPLYSIGESGVRGPRWTLPDGDSCEVGAYIPCNRDWIYGVLSVVVHYAASSTSGNIDWFINISPVVDLTAASRSSVIETIAPPTVADVTTTATFNTASIASGSEVGKQHIGVVVSVGRRGGSDSNSGDVYIYGFELIYKEKRRTFGAKA